MDSTSEMRATLEHRRPYRWGGQATAPTAMAPLRCPGPCLMCDDGPTAVNAERRSARVSLLTGHCPCCGGGMLEWTGNRPVSTYQPQTVAEGVRLCGRCIGNNHHTDPPGFLAHLLIMCLPDPPNGILLEHVYGLIEWIWE